MAEKWLKVDTKLVLMKYCEIGQKSYNELREVQNDRMKNSLKWAEKHRFKSCLKTLKKELKRVNLLKEQMR